MVSEEPPAGSCLQHLVCDRLCCSTPVPTQCVHVCVTCIHTHIYGHSLLPSKISERCKYSSLQLQFSHRKLSPYCWIVFPRPGDKPHIPCIRLCQDAEPQGSRPQPHGSAIGPSLSHPRASLGNARVRPLVRAQCSCKDCGGCKYAVLQTTVRIVSPKPQ